eukprot:1380698-Prymnesium_polylepis.2
MIRNHHARDGGHLNGTTKLSRTCGHQWQGDVLDWKHVAAVASGAWRQSLKVSDESAGRAKRQY